LPKLSGKGSFEWTRGEEHIHLYGNELNMGWVVSLDRFSGHFSTSLVNAEGAFVIFGVWTPL
jgi:hypothetical protein